MTIWTLRAAILIALLGAGTLGLAVVTRPATSHAAPLAQATATPTNTATPTSTATPTATATSTATPTPTSTPRAAAGWQRIDQPDGNVRCYIYQFAAETTMSCVVVTP